MGLPLLRIQNGGYEEQLIDGVTGFDLGSPSPEIRPEQVQLINRLRDPKRVPESKLGEMAFSARSHVEKFSKINYGDWLLRPGSIKGLS